MKTTTELIEAYRKAAILHRTASRDGRYKVANNAYAEGARIFNRFRRGDIEMQRAFLALLGDENLFVRFWAAVDSLKLDSDRAVAVLEEIAAGPFSMESLDAESILCRWKEGSFHIP